MGCVASLAADDFFREVSAQTVGVEVTARGIGIPNGTRPVLEVRRSEASNHTGALR